MLYSRNTFCFDDIETINSFPRTILPCRLSALKILEVYLTANNQGTLLCHGASPIQHAMSGMTGLQTIRVVSLRPGDQCAIVDRLMDRFRRDFQSSTDANMVLIGNVKNSSTEH